MTALTCAGCGVTFLTSETQEEITALGKKMHGPLAKDDDFVVLCPECEPEFLKWLAKEPNNRVGSA